MHALARLVALTAVFSPALLAAPASAQDVAAGERSWNKCRACHQIGEGAKNIVGPQLNGLFGRTAGTVEGYSYSAANKNSGITWDEAVFAEYIKDPRAKILAALPTQIRTPAAPPGVDLYKDAEKMTMAQYRKARGM